jgi:hypothetical protein
MRKIFGPQTEQVLKFLADLWLLSPDQISTVTAAWKQASELERAEAWAELHRVASGDDWDEILAAASVARRQAMDAAYLLHRVDWAFWAAAWDAAAAIAADERIGSGYYVLARPLMTVMPSRSESRPGARVPAQRAGTRAAPERDDLSQDRAGESSAAEGTSSAQEPSAAGHEVRSPGTKLAGGGDEEPVPSAVRALPGRDGHRGSRGTDQPGEQPG